MEATIQSTNRAINIDINVSINVCALKANIQRGLQAIKQSAWQAIKQSVLMPIKQRVLKTVKQATNKRINVGVWSLPRLYRKELRLARAVARAIDAHPTISNIFLWIMGAACFWAVLTYNFTTHI